MEAPAPAVAKGNSLIAVYGTLKKGYGNHRRIAEARLVGKFTTTPDYKIFCNGSFPYMIEVTADGVCVEVEVYEVTPAQVASMDRLEGHPHHYMRKAVQLQGIDGVEAYIYQNENGARRCRDCGTSWPGV